MHHVTEASAHSAPERGNGAAKWAPVHCSKGVEGSGAGSVSRGSEDQQPAHPLRSFWRLAGGFWGRGEPLISWLLSAALLLVVVLALAGSYGMNVWYRVIFDALQSRESSTVLSLSLLYLPLLAGSVLVSVMQLRLRMSMQRRWRAWLNHRLLDRWLRDGRYYQLDLDRRPSPESRRPDRRRRADRHRGAGRVGDRTDDRGTLGGDLHRGALDRRRRRNRRDRQRGRYRSWLPRGRGGGLCGPGRYPTLSRTNSASLSAQRYSKSATATVPYRSYRDHPIAASSSAPPCCTILSCNLFCKAQRRMTA